MAGLNLIVLLSISVAAFVLAYPQRCIFNERRGIVDCRGEQWTHIPYDYLREKSFHTLDLGVNNITSLKDTSRFFELETKGRIETILLDSNQISDLPHHLLDALPNLQFLDFSNNNLKHISRQFCHMSGLAELILDGNPIESISKNAFRCLGNLKKLSLANTELRRLPFDFVKDMFRLEEVNLVGNEMENLDDIEFPPDVKVSVTQMRKSFSSSSIEKSYEVAPDNIVENKVFQTR